MSFAKTKTDESLCVPEVPRTCESNGSSEGTSLRGRLRRRERRASMAFAAGTWEVAC